MHIILHFLAYLFAICFPYNTYFVYCLYHAYDFASFLILFYIFSAGGRGTCAPAGGTYGVSAGELAATSDGLHKWRWAYLGPRVREDTKSEEQRVACSKAPHKRWWMLRAHLPELHNYVSSFRGRTALLSTCMLQNGSTRSIPQPPALRFGAHRVPRSQAGPRAN